MSSKQADAMKEKGNEEYKKGNYEKAIEFYTYATEMDPNNHVFYTNRAMCYAAMKKWDKSLRDAEKSITIKKDWEKGHYRKGVALQNLGRLQDAVTSFAECVKLAPNSADFAKAHDIAKKEMYKGLTDAEILKIEGNEMFKQGKIDPAIAKYTTALQKCPDDKELMPSEGGSAAATAGGKTETGKETKTEKFRAIKADVYANRAACYVQLYEPNKVKADCDAALRLVPNHGKALLRRGQALESLEKYKAALEDFEVVLKMDPTNKMAVSAAVRLRNALRRQNAL
jgi:tetratricopeptide (TPR) repeat protein